MTDIQLPAGATLFGPAGAPELPSDLAGILDHVPVGLVVVDENGGIVYENAAARRMLGLQVGEAGISIGMRVQEMPSVRAAGLDTILSDVLSGREVEQRTVEFTSIYGAHFVMSLRCQSIRSQEGRVVGGAIWMTLPDAREGGELRSLQQLQRLSLANAEVAHDINNLLGSVAARLDLIEDAAGTSGPVTEQVVAARGLIIRSRELVQRLRHAARRDRIRREQVDLIALTRRVVERYGGERPDVRVRFTAPDVTALRMPLDASEVEQACTNLVQNALQALEGRSDGRVEVKLSTGQGSTFLEGRLRPDVSYARLSVVDNGVGIAEENLARVFEPYFTTREEGTGIGLSVVRGVAMRHGGAVTVTSRPAVGTRFDLYLREEDAATVTDAGSIPRLTGLRLVLGDVLDDVALSALGETGADVVRVDSVGAAAAAAAEPLGSPEAVVVVLSDRFVPMGGFEGAIRQIGAARGDAAVVVSWLAATPTPGLRTNCGLPVTWVQRPYSVGELMRVVGRLQHERSAR